MGAQCAKNDGFHKNGWKSRGHISIRISVACDVSAEFFSLKMSGGTSDT
jgi:hypothetical protein